MYCWVQVESTGAEEHSIGVDEHEESALSIAVSNPPGMIIQMNLHGARSAVTTAQAAARETEVLNFILSGNSSGSETSVKKRGKLSTRYT